MYREILLAVDGSENSWRAAQQAARLGGSGAVITILHALDPDDTQRDMARSSSEREVAKQKKNILSSVVRYFDEKGIEHRYLGLRGLPSRTIIEEANTGKYDIIIIGSRGLNAFQEMVLGSVSHRVAKHSSIPVMIVK